MIFTESNTVGQMILDAVTDLNSKGIVRRKDSVPYNGESLWVDLCPVRWTYAPYDQAPRQLTCPRTVYGQCSTRDRE